MNVKVSKAANGVRVVTSVMPHVQSVAMGIWAGVGSRYETPELNGASHFVEHLMFKGTRRRSARDISMAIEGRGGYLNAFTAEENTCYYARVGHTQLKPALDVLADMYQHSSLDRQEITRERQVILEEILMYADQPQHVVQEMLSDLLWRNHPLGQTITGTPDTLAQMNRTTLQTFVKENYVTSNTVVAFSGQLEHERCVDLVSQLMPAVSALRPGLRARKADVAVKQGRTAFRSKDVEQSQLALGIRLFGYQSEDRHALRVLSAVLGENMSSRLFQVVREKHGLAYSVQSSVQLFEESGALVISAGLDRKRMEKALDLIVREMVRLKERPVGAAELKRAKDYVIGQLQLGLESTLHQMMWVGENLSTRGCIIFPDEVIRGISKVSADDVQRLARRTMCHSRTSLAVVSQDLKSADERRMKDCLRRL